MRKIGSMPRTARLFTGIIGSVLLLLGVLTVHSTPAHAISGACFYYPDSGNHATLNAWNGGPAVKVYHSCADPNDRFTILFPGGGNVQLEFTGVNSNSNKCIGDTNNDAGNASTGLTGCSPAGWGTLFTEQTSGCGSGQLAFRNNHWNGYLGPPNPYSDGSEFYLNNFGFFCFTIA